MRFVLLAVVLMLTPARVALAQSEITDEEIRSILRDRVDVAKKSVGVVVGLVDEHGVRVVGHGKPSRESAQTVQADTVFEIASVTKVFTTTLLSDMVERGEVRLDDPISKYLPRGVRAPARNGKQITLLHLATHTSGLPRDADCLNALCRNLWPGKDKYSAERMYGFLSNYKLSRDIGARFEYSNYGMALLGNLLAMRAGKDYETLVRTRILEPLHMSDTGFKATAGMQARLAQGHDEALMPVPDSEDPVWVRGAGGLYSTTNDLLKFLAANLGLSPSPLRTAMEKAHQTKHGTDTPGWEIGLGWQIMKRFEGEIVWHNGISSNGYRSFIGMDKKARRGVVVLWNSGNDLNDIGRHLLDSRYALARERHAIKLDVKVFDAYTGDDQLAPGFLLKMSRNEDKLFMQVTSSGSDPGAERTRVAG